MRFGVFQFCFALWRWVLERLDLAIFDDVELDYPAPAARTCFYRLPHQCSVQCYFSSVLSARSEAALRARSNYYALMTIYALS